MSKNIIPISSALRHSPYRTPAEQYLRDGGARPEPEAESFAPDSDHAPEDPGGFRGSAPLFAFGGAVVVLLGMIFAILLAVLAGMALFALAFRKSGRQRAPFALRLMRGGASPVGPEPEEDPDATAPSRRLGDSIVTRG